MMRPSIRQVIGSAVLLCTTLLVVPGAGAAGVVPSDMPNPLPADQGVVAGTLVMDFQDSAPELRDAVLKLAGMSVTIRRADDPQARDIRFVTSPEEWGKPGVARVTGTDRRQLFFGALAPGAYDVTERAAYMSNRSVVIPTNGPPLRFTVAPGAITYIGAYVLKAHAGKNFLGRPVFASATIGVDDDAEDDGRQLYHVRPDLRAMAMADVFNGALLPAPGLQVAPEGGMKDGVPLYDVAAVKASSGIPAAVFARLEAFRPSVPPAEPGILRWILLQHTVTRDGKPAGTGTLRLQYLAKAPGYVYDSVTRSTGVTQELEYMPFIMVRTHVVKHVDAKSLFALTVDASAEATLSDVKLPVFDEAMKPGITWNMETESDTNVKARSVLQSQDRSNFSIVKSVCTTLDRQAAATLSGDLAGTMLTVSCQELNQPANERVMAYLEEYGVFVLLRTSSTAGAQGTRTVNEFRVLRVELAGHKPVGSPPAPGASEPANAE